MEAPAAHQRPAGQTLHVVCPSSSWYSPAGHLSHDDAPSLAAIVPAVHGVEMIEPVVHEEPAGQRSQSVPAALLLVVLA